MDQQQQQQQQHVAEAASALVRATTDSATRSQASKFLEDWNATTGPAAWHVYAQWLASFRVQPSVSNGSANAEQLGMQLLCLTLLQSRIRSQVTLQPKPDQQASMAAIKVVQNELWELLSYLSHQVASSPLGTDIAQQPMVQPTCNCVVGLAARCGETSHLVQTLVAANATHGLVPDFTIRLLGSLPAQIEDAYWASNQNDASPLVTQELRNHLPSVMQVARQGLLSADSTIMLTSLQALLQWNAICHVTLSELNMPSTNDNNNGNSNSNSNSTTLSLLIQILSVENPIPANQQHAQSKLHPKIWQAASQALAEALLIPSDQLTPLRQAAAGALYTAINTQGMIQVPLQICARHMNQDGVDEGWEDATHDLATLICTFVSEELDEVIQQPAETCLSILLELTSHPQTSVVLAVLDVWLAVQEMEVAQRHANWRSPLFDTICTRLLQRMAYPSTFTNWEDELEVDSSSFEELRRMAPDVFVASYYLSRLNLVQSLGSPIQQMTQQQDQRPHWTVLETSFYALGQISKDVSARVKGQGGSTQMQQDRQATGQYLLQLLQFVLSMPPDAVARQHNLLLLQAMVTFCGSYAISWKAILSSGNSSHTPQQVLIPLLDYLQAALQVVPFAAAKAIRAIYIGCFCKSNLLAQVPNAPNPFIPSVLASVRNTLQVALASQDADTMKTVAEGATRVITQLTDPTTLQQSLSNDLFNPVVAQVQQVVSQISLDVDLRHSHDANKAAELQLNLETLSNLLGVVQSMVRFCDSSPIPGMGEWVLGNVSALLDGVTQHASKYPEMLLAKLVTIQQQLLKSISVDRQVVAPTFTKTIPFIVEAYSHTFESCCLKYVATAVEVFGPPQATPSDPSGSSSQSYDSSFLELWSHLTTITAQHASSKKLEDLPELMQAYFECCQRFILYCPIGLLHNQHLSTIIQLAVECISGCNGEQRSTREALSFVSQFFGWKQLRLSPHSQSVFEASAGVVQEHLVANGQTLMSKCIGSLAGGPQILWPSLSDCVVSILTYMISIAPPGETTTVAHTWIFTAMTETGASSSKASPDVCEQILKMLDGLIRQDEAKSKSKARSLLSDYAKFSKGEIGPDTLMNYVMN